MLDMTDLYDTTPYPVPGSNQPEASLSELIVNPGGLVLAHAAGVEGEPDVEMQRLYRTCMEVSLSDVQSVPGTSVIMYMLIERCVYAYVTMKSMERGGYMNVETRRYNQLFTLFQKTSTTVLEQMKRLFADQTNLQYIFISKVMETLKASVIDAIPPAESERMLKNVRDNLQALIQTE